MLPESSGATDSTLFPVYQPGASDLAQKMTAKQVMTYFDANSPRLRQLPDEISTLVNTALTQAKESGEFDGPPGPAGSDASVTTKNVLNAIKGYMPTIEFDSYVGNGKSGAQNPCTLNFPRTPYLVIIVADNGFIYPSGTVFISGQSRSDGIGNNNGHTDGMQLNITWGDTSVSWYTTNTSTVMAPSNQLNANNQLYHYFAICL